MNVIVRAGEKCEDEAAYLMPTFLEFGLGAFRSTTDRFCVVSYEGPRRVSMETLVENLKKKRQRGFF
jgi:hypothetical protein